MKYTLQFRIWHWFNAIVVLGLLATFFLRKTFLSWKTNSEIIMTKLSEMGIEITAQQAGAIAKAIRAGMWEWHIIFGYALAFLMVYRIYLFFTDKSEKKPFKELDLHHKGVRISYYVIYATLIYMSVSGLAIHFSQDIGISKGVAHDLKEIHESLAYILVYFVPLHIAGVLIAENRDETGLVSTMIHGKEF